MVTWACNPSGGFEVDGDWLGWGRWSLMGLICWRVPRHPGEGLDGVAPRVAETATSRSSMEGKRAGAPQVPRTPPQPLTI